MTIIDKAMVVLRQFAGNARTLGVSDLSRTTGMDKASVHRLMKALARHHFVEQDPVTRRYELGLLAVELAGAKLRQMPLAEVAQPHLARLSQDTGETVQMSVLHDLRVLYIAIVESPQPIRVAAGVGAFGPLHCTAAGKVLLAFQPKSVREDVLKRSLRRYTPNTLTDAAKLRRELDQVARDGRAIDDGGFVEHLRVAAAPIRGRSGEVIAAVAVGGPSIRVTRRQLSKFASLVVATAAAISRDVASAA